MRATGRLRARQPRHYPQARPRPPFLPYFSLTAELLNEHDPPDLMAVLTLVSARSDWGFGEHLVVVGSSL